MSKKKANKEGSIVKRKDGRYMGRYTLDNKRYAIYGATYDEVRIKLTEALANINKGIYSINSEYTLSQWLRKWLELYALPTIKQSTYVSYESYVRLHLVPELGKSKLSSLSIDQLQRFFNKKQKQLSPKSLRNIYNMLHNCLEQAIINKHLTYNPLHGVKLPPVLKKDITILSLSDQNILHSAVISSNTPAAFGIIFTLSTGLRLGELIGLQWSDLDFANHSIHIRRTVGRLLKVDESGNLIEKRTGVPTTEIVTRSPKSKTAQRNIPLFPAIWRDLMSYRNRQQEMLQVEGLLLTPSTPIFSTTSGTIYEPRTYEDLFKRTLKSANLPNINFHALRHTFATRALEAGMDIKVLSSILGHAQASTTLNLYAHTLPDHKKDSMDKMGFFYYNTLNHS